MKVKNDNVQESRYDLNSHQSIIVRKEVIKNTLKKIKFPIIILDLEFFNRSHSTRNFKGYRCNLAEGQSYVYLLQFATYASFKELIKSDPKKTIKNLSLERKQEVLNYSFETDYQLLKEKFMEVLVKQKIKTIVLAGASNDQQIINSWFDDYRKLKKETIELTFWDIYPTLEQAMSFNNLTASGEIFWEPNNLKKGFSGDNSLSLPSLKKFFNYMNTVFPNFAHNDDADIYHLSREILDFFCRKKLTPLQYQQGRSALAHARDHCFNDVYKLVTIIKYWVDLAMGKDQLKKSQEFKF